MKSYITSDPKILGGTPVIKGTRIPVSRVIFLLKEGYTVEAIHQDYPHVPANVIETVIDEVVNMVDSSRNDQKISKVQVAS
ncbi:hypothetical protein A3A54_02565 [Candidatus Curtissbacteria bacterium RIFCSPLOWO2_01_FULL_39_62]|nr:MAG: hypothetical protein A3E11_00625 [Candidatus Curtissbacteria bacterium RIFCSPHIGHO2_12_FULL_38_37]OGE00772.1 MAG: hypothetical protein A3J17_02135 [Candidatus Curtissbacteria bacterium RIFCSPLOWO2_02_FULL_40_11]OGE02303.1 MAG: hypothetical protein A3A54_02565 [Candidatus Curtissbacteria bacterium RIFCSPLOWO2_01_FULL_39_62]